MNNFKLFLLIILTFGVFFSKTKKVMGCCFFSGRGVVFVTLLDSNLSLAPMTSCQNPLKNLKSFILQTIFMLD